MIVLDFFPFNKPSGSGKIKLPDCDIEIYSRDTTSTYIERYVKADPTKSYDIDMEKLKANKSKDNYTLNEIKEIAGNLGIKGISIMSKKDIIKLILLKLEKN